MREKTVEDFLVDMVESTGGLCLKFVSPGRRNVPDRLCIIPKTHPFFVEVKAPNKEPRDAQWREIYRLRERNANAYVVDCKNDVMRVLQIELHQPKVRRKVSFEDWRMREKFI